MLVQQYAPAICQDGTYPCKGVNADWTYSTLHGLWAENNSGSYPQHCSTEPFDPSAVAPIQDELNKYWVSLNGPSESFWNHEWTTHGTCATDVFPSQLAFFNGTLALRDRFDFVSSLAASGLKPGGPSFTLSQLNAAVNNAYGHVGTVDCDSKGWITGYTQCISKNLQATTCQGISSKCKASTLTLVAPQ